MKQYKLIVIGVGILSLFLIVQVFITANPFELRNKKLDEQRLDDLSDISRRINEHYQTHGSLPENLSELRIRGDLVFNDPTEKKPYEYYVESEISYQLCAWFQTDDISNPNEPTLRIYPSDLSVNRQKGYSCIPYTVPNRYLSPTPGLPRTSSGPARFPSPTITKNPGLIANAIAKVGPTTYIQVQDVQLTPQLIVTVSVTNNSSSPQSFTLDTYIQGTSPAGNKIPLTGEGTIQLAPREVQYQTLIASPTTTTPNIFGIFAIDESGKDLRIATFRIPATTPALEQ